MRALQNKSTQKENGRMTLPSSERKWKRVEFLTYDGLTLRGNLYLSEKDKTAPIIIMTQGLALLKEHYLQNWAERFQDSGFNVLTYDHRNFGHSDGEPRNEVDLNAQSDDYVDAVSFAQKLGGNVGTQKIFTWGIGHSGGGAAVHASMDRRISGVILMMPSLSGNFDFNNWPKYLIDKDVTDRLHGRDTSLRKADYWQFWPVTEKDKEGKGNSMLSGDLAFNWMKGALKLTEEGGNKFENKVAISSLHSIYKARPNAYFKDIAPTPTLLLAATEDSVATSYKDEIAIFETMGQPKEFVTLEGDHLPSYFGKQFEIGVEAMIKFVRKYSS